MSKNKSKNNSSGSSSSKEKRCLFSRVHFAQGRNAKLLNLAPFVTICENVCKYFKNVFSTSMAALHFGTRRTCCCCCWCGCSVEFPRRGQRKLAKRCCVWLRWKVCYSFCIARTCVRVLLAPTAICHSLSCSLTPALSLSPAHSLALLHSLKISFSLVFRLFGIRFAFSSVDFMNLTLFGCGSLCRRRRRQREARRAWSVAKVAASTWQAAADGLKVAVCVTLPEQILVNKHSAAQKEAAPESMQQKYGRAAQHGGVY